LNSVLKYRESLEKNERNVLAEMNGALRKLVNELEELEGECSRAITIFNIEMAQGMGIPDIIASDLYIKSIERSIDEKILEIKKQEKQVSRQTSVVIRATQDTKTLDKLKEKRQIAYDFKENKIQELFIEEFVSGQTVRQI